MSNEPVDIIIPWVNSNDETWRQEFMFWKKRETGNKDLCRFIDHGTLKFVLRSIEKFCPWCRHVFLILSSPSQIPDWLDTNNPKLKIICHEDYIPKEFLPTFNSNVIELFYSHIEELSENFILMNDDYYFWNDMGEEFYFKNDLPVYNPKFSRIVLNGTQFQQFLKNSLNFNNKILAQNAYRLNTPDHLIVSYKKSLQKFILDKYKDELVSTFNKSRFRTNTNVMHWMFYDLAVRLGMCCLDQRNRGQFILMNHGRKLKVFGNPGCVCLNECEKTDMENINDMLSVLKRKFVFKCGFER